ncbi:MAG: sugar transferase [Smithellaceae bacterium]
MNLPESLLEIKSLVSSGNIMKLADSTHDNDHVFHDETHFRYMLRIERMRTERSQKPFILLLLNISKLMTESRKGETIACIKTALLPSLREVDIRGWYHKHHTIGIIFTEIATDQAAFIKSVIHKTSYCLCERLDPDEIDKIEYSFHLYPENNGVSSSDKIFNINLYPDLTNRNINKAFSLTIKKVIDIIGSGLALLCLSPLFLMIAAVIKATSPGPVFFKQHRVGFNGKKFSMFKFRSMKNNCDSAEHRSYIKQYICEQNSAAVEPGVFKLTNDSRITPIGHILRKTSLDELPQLINVLIGDMSLVGPRPPIPYECELYNIWHRRRFLSFKPGITGLWQVTGRSRTTFDEMVRLDLKYIREWDLWSDIKILFMTPRAVVNGSGAL